MERKIKLVIFDLDGCFTDGSLIDHVFNSKDTFGLKKLNKLKIKTAIISQSKEKITNRIIIDRIDYIINNIDNKVLACDKLIKELKINYNEVAYIGDDEPDIELLKKVKISACPSDAIPRVKKIAEYVSEKCGGKGAVRDFIEYVLKKNKTSHKNRIKLIDCSWRDGGYKNNWDFNYKETIQAYNAINKSKIEYFEIGFRSTKLKGGGKWLYSSNEDIKMIKENLSGKRYSKIAVMFKYGEYDLKDICKDSPIDLYRILIKNGGYNREHNQFIIETVKKINSFGKKVSLNIPCGHKLDPKLKNLIDSIFKTKLKVDIFYLADTFGSMDEKIILKSFNKLYDMIKKWEDNPVFGFHIHNNNGDALHKALFSLNKIPYLRFLDSCINGIGRGIGNLRTEDILIKLNNNFDKEYNYLEIYEYIYKKEDKYRAEILYKLSGEYVVHPNYIFDILKQRLDFNESLLKIKKISKYKTNLYKENLI